MDYDETIRMMLPFVTIDYADLTGQTRRDSLAKVMHHEIVLRTQHVFEKAEGYRDADSVLPIGGTRVVHGCTIAGMALNQPPIGVEESRLKMIPARNFSPAQTAGDSIFIRVISGTATGEC